VKIPHAWALRALLLTTLGAAPIAADPSTRLASGETAPATAAAATTGTAAAPPATATSMSIRRVAWLAGCWELSADGRTVEEHWLAPRGGNMVNVGRTMKGDALVEFEQVVLREDGDRLAYEAHPSGQAGAVFHSKSVGDGSVVFENLEHDFPQRVGYDRKGDTLVGWIEGERNGKTRRIEFPYKRVACPGS
jgi:hypothetical protein